MAHLFSRTQLPSGNPHFTPKITPWTEFYIARGLEQLRLHQQQLEQQQRLNQSLLNNSNANLSTAASSIASSSKLRFQVLRSKFGCKNQTHPIAEDTTSNASSSTPSSSIASSSVKSSSRSAPLPSTKTTGYSAAEPNGANGDSTSAQSMNSSRGTCSTGDVDHLHCNRSDGALEESSSGRVVRNSVTNVFRKLSSQVRKTSKVNLRKGSVTTTTTTTSARGDKSDSNPISEESLQERKQRRDFLRKLYTNAVSPAHPTRGHNNSSTGGHSGDGPPNNSSSSLRLQHALPTTLPPQDLPQEPTVLQPPPLPPPSFPSTTTATSTISPTVLDNITNVHPPVTYFSPSPLPPPPSLPPVSALPSHLTKSSNQVLLPTYDPILGPSDNNPQDNYYNRRGYYPSTNGTVGLSLNTNLPSSCVSPNSNSSAAGVAVGEAVLSLASRFALQQQQQVPQPQPMRVTSSPKFVQRKGGEGNPPGVVYSALSPNYQPQHSTGISSNQRPGSVMSCGSSQEDVDALIRWTNDLSLRDSWEVK